MIFYFRDLNCFEKQVYDDVLYEHNVKHKIFKKHIAVDAEDVDFPFGDDIDEVYIINYDIEVNTNLEMWDYLNWVINKRIKIITKLNKSFYTKNKNKKEKVKSKK